jgi:hypothetical protein
MTKKTSGSWSVRAMTLCLVTMPLSFHALADGRICTNQEARAAEAVAATARSLEELHRQFESYSHCDDGAIAEGFSEAVTLLLAERWQKVQRSYKVLRHDSAFRAFVIRHIDETVPTERLNRIAENAQKRCSSEMKGLCLEIQMAAKKAAQAASDTP